MKKKALLLMLTIFATLLLTACGGKEEIVDVESAGGTMEPTVAASADTEADKTLQAEPTTEPTSEVKLAVTTYPTIKADVPDLDIIRVGENYYMVSTTMNLCPGAPIMKSTDLVHWQIVNYVYDTFEDDDITNLRNGQDMYGRGSWAASLKYDEETKLYYVAFNSNNHGFYIYTTDDIENGTFTKYHCYGGYHDPALYFEDGKMYVVSASGGTCSITQLRLTSSGGIEKVGNTEKLFTSSNFGLWEGAHINKVGEYYYVFIIASPTDRWMRTEVCYRSKVLFGGAWEEKIVYQKGVGGNGAGLAQGGIIETQYGDYYAFLFQDRGSLGRCPSIICVEWRDGWPMMGTYDAAGEFSQDGGVIKQTINLPEDTNGNYIVDSDDFDYTEEKLKLVWQWNHNPQNDYWSVTKNPGHLRLTTDAVVDNLCYAHNSLTQRTMYKTTTSIVKMNADNMKPGDYAGLAAVADHYAMVGVMCDANGEKHFFQANANFKENFDAPNEVADVAIHSGEDVYLKIVFTYKNGEDSAYFFYSLDGENYTEIGEDWHSNFSTATTFMGQRVWLYNYATKEAGGYVDFDSYEVTVKN